MALYRKFCKKVQQTAGLKKILILTIISLSVIWQNIMQLKKCLNMNRAKIGEWL